MVSTDPISDMLSRIRNAIAVNKASVSMPYSKMKAAIAQKLADNGFINRVSKEQVDGRDVLVIEINDEGGSSVITELNRLSKPGRRTYVQSKAIPAVRRGRGLVIVSTSQGVMTGTEAKAKNLGGELLCEVY